MKKKIVRTKKRLSPRSKLKKPGRKTAAGHKQRKENATGQIIGLYNLKVPAGAHKPKKLLGRGPSSGHGKTSTRGSKGQTSRAGRDFYAGFEGGQTPLIRRIPKRGFTSRDKKEYQVVNLDDLNRIKEPMITPVLLEEKGLIRNKDKLIKILGDGELKNPVTIQAHAFSKKASEEIKKKGGKIELINV